MTSSHVPLLKPVVAPAETARLTIYDMHSDLLTEMTDDWLDRAIDVALNDVDLYRMRVIMVPSALPALARYRRVRDQLIGERERRRATAKPMEDAS